MVEPSIAIGFDFGLYHIGVAIGQTLTQSANIQPSISAQKGKPDWKTLDRLIATWQPHYLIVGMPYQEDGSHQAISQAALKFKTQLIKRYPKCQVFDHDERYTTQLAKAAIFDEMGIKNPEKALIDGFAAKLILEEWMITHKT